jgi:hypothetical protein
MNLQFMHMVSRLLIATVLCLVLPLQQAYAGIVSTDRVAASAQSQSERERIRTFFDREDVRKQLQAQGIDVKAANARVDALTDDEVHKVAGNLDNMPAGGDILGLIFLVFVILLITDILGLTKVFSFTRTVR